MHLEVTKWRETASAVWSERMAYKSNFVIMVIAPALVFFLVKYNLWTSIFGSNGATRIGGYTLAQMIEYQAWVLIVVFLAQSYNSMALAEDIRYGRISAYLLYPFSFWKFHTARFLSLQILQQLVALVTLLVFCLLGLILELDLWMLFVGLAFSLLVGGLWFAIQFLFGLMAFWLDETWVLRALFVTISNFLSGSIIPLELYPKSFARVLEYTPFPYLTFVPVRILSGEYVGSIGFAFLVVTLWIVLAVALVMIAWKRGIRLYSAAGI